MLPFIQLMLLQSLCSSLLLRTFNSHLMGARNWGPFTNSTGTHPESVSSLRKHEKVYFIQNLRGHT